MKNVTFRLDENALEAARTYAAENGRTVDDLIGEYLAGIADQVETLALSAAQRRQVREELLELSERSPGRLGEWKWNREDIYRERFSRYEYPGLRSHGQGGRRGEEGAGE
jgi:hypothetical protein